MLLPARTPADGALPVAVWRPHGRGDCPGDMLPVQGRVGHTWGRWAGRDVVGEVDRLLRSASRGVPVIFAAAEGHLPGVVGQALLRAPPRPPGCRPVVPADEEEV